MRKRKKRLLFQLWGWNNESERHCLAKTVIVFHLFSAYSNWSIESDIILVGMFHFVSCHLPLPSSRFPPNPEILNRDVNIKQIPWGFKKDGIVNLRKPHSSLKMGLRHNRERFRGFTSFIFWRNTRTTFILLTKQKFFGLVSRSKLTGRLWSKPSIKGEKESRARKKRMLQKTRVAGKRKYPGKSRNLSRISIQFFKRLTPLTASTNKSYWITRLRPGRSRPVGNLSPSSWWGIGGSYLPTYACLLCIRRLSWLSPPGITRGFVRGRSQIRRIPSFEPRFPRFSLSARGRIEPNLGSFHGKPFPRGERADVGLPGDPRESVRDLKLACEDETLIWSWDLRILFHFPLISLEKRAFAIYLKISACCFALRPILNKRCIEPFANAFKTVTWLML